MNLQTYKETHDLSLQEMADEVGGVTASRVGKYCSGSSWPKPLRLAKILKVFPGVTVDEMFTAHLLFINRQEAAVVSKTLADAG